METRYNVNYTINSGDGRTMSFKVIVEFAHVENTYGNGYHMCIEGESEPFGFTSYDIRYDSSFDIEDAIPYIAQVFSNRYTGKDGSWKLIGIRVHEAE